MDKISFTTDNLILFISEFMECDIGSRTHEEICNFVNEKTNDICKTCGNMDLTYGSNTIIDVYRYCEQCSFMVDKHIDRRKK